MSLANLDIRARINRLPRWLVFIILEGWPVLILLFALAIEFRHIASSNWLQLFLYNGDSLTLALMHQSLAHRDAFLWVSSSQFLIFPEGLFYAISSVLTKSIRATLVFNGALNIIILYVLFRWAAGTFAKATRYIKQLFALGCCLLLIFYMLLERQAFINSSSVATLFIFTTYYYGVIISGASLLCIMLQQTKDLPAVKKISKPQLWLASVAFLIAALTSFSDPLFIIQFVIPLMIALGIALLCNGLKLKHTLLVGMPILGGSAIGYVARLPFKNFLGESLSGHIITQQIPDTLAVFHQATSNDLQTKSGSLELLLVFVVIGFSAIYSGWWIYQKTHNKARLLDGRLLVLSLFTVIVPPLVILFSIAIGSKVTRYLLPMIIFPMFGLLPMLTSKLLEKSKSIIVPSSILLSLFILVLGSFSAGKANHILSNSYADTGCLAAALHNEPAYGVGQYWSVRTLNVYGRPDEVALQIKPDLSPFVWQANLGSYRNKKISFIIVDKQASGSPQAVLPTDPYLPANPSKIYSCKDIYVYTYATGTDGYNQLNDIFHKHYNNLMRLRSAGDTSQLF